MCAWVRRVDPRSGALWCRNPTLRHIHTDMNDTEAHTHGRECPHRLQRLASSCVFAGPSCTASLRPPTRMERAREGRRQVPGAEVAVTQNIGGAAASVFSHVFIRR